jgi:hypothetical protein
LLRPEAKRGKTVRQFEHDKYDEEDAYDPTDGLDEADESETEEADEDETEEAEVRWEDGELEGLGGTGLVVRVRPSRLGRKRQVEAMFDGRHLHADTFDPFDATARSTFANAVVEAAETAEGVGEGKVELGDVSEHVLAAAKDAEAATEAGKKRGAKGGTDEFYAVDDDEKPVEQHGLYLLRDGDDKPVRLANFVVRLQRDTHLDDDFQSERIFEGVVRLHGETSPISITAARFADSQKLTAAVFDAAGPKAQFVAEPPLVRRAISQISTPERVRHTTAHGWNDDGTCYLTSGGVIDADGWREYRPDEVRVDLSADGPHKGSLGLISLEPDELRRAKQVVVEDFLRLHERLVTFTLLGSVAMAVLEPFGGLAQRPGVWLTGLTGAGKSFATKLAANFFSDADINDGTKFGGWTSTANYLERCGYYHRGALYVCDDYKPELVKPEHAVRLLQSYADRNARGRLQADAKANVSRPIRGLLVVTGEDLPENNASVLARLIVVPVPNHRKDLATGRRCIEARRLFRGVTTGFIAWLLREGRLTGFAARVAEHQTRIYERIAGQQNDARISGNFALLAASFEEIAAYLADVWPGHKAETAGYIEQDLTALLDGMLHLTQEQQASEVFWATLREALEFGRAALQKYLTDKPEHGEVFVGRYYGGDYASVSLRLALGVVQQQLRMAGRTELKVSEKALADQLRADGLVEPDDKGGAQLRIAGSRTRTVTVAVEALGVDKRPSMGS